MEKEGSSSDDLFGHSQKFSDPATRLEERKKFINPSMESADDFKRKRDETAEAMRRRERESRFKSKRMENGEEFIITEQEGVAGKGTMEDTGKVGAAALQTPMSVLAELPGILLEIRQPDHDKCLNALKRLRKLLSAKGYTPIQEVIDAGVLPILLEYALREQESQIQFEAVWCITNIATGNEEQVQAIIKKGGIKILKEVLKSPHRPNQEQAIWALGNIAGENFVLRNMVLEEGVAPLICQVIINETVYSLLKSAVWCLANLCRGKPQPPLTHVAPAFKAIAAAIMKHSDEKILVDACWTLYYLSDGGDLRIPHVIDTGVVPRLVNLLLHRETRIALPCLRVLGNITTGSDDQTQIVVDAGGVLALKELMKSSSKALRKEGCWVLSNIAAGAPHQLKKILAADAIPIVCKILIEDEFEIKREALWIIANATNKMAPEHVNYMLRAGVVDALVGLLGVPEPKALAVVLQGLENMLKKEKELHTDKNDVALRMETIGCLPTLEQLQYHPNQMIYKMASDMLERYFSLEDVEEVLAHGEDKSASGGISIFDF